VTHRIEGGIAVCNFCGFACIVEGPRKCCLRGAAHDATPHITESGAMYWNVRDIIYGPGYETKASGLKLTDFR
jgi:hypothetical protein